MERVFFFRGLSTYGGDDAKFSIFNFGPMYQHFERAFRARGLDFRPVTGMGAGTLAEVTARALEFLRADEVFQSPTPVHFCGHSAGGVIARLALAELAPEIPSGKVASLLTIASPNKGSKLARLCMDLPGSGRSRSVRALRRIGYDLGAKRHFFAELTEEAIARAFSDDSPAPGTRHASIVCSAPRAEWSWPLRLLYKIHAFRDFQHESDGVVEKDSQAYGEVLAELEIDHIREIGLFGRRERFEQLCDIAAEFFNSSSLEGPRPTVMVK